MKKDCSFCEKLEKYNFGNYMFQTSHWIIFLAPNQSNLGTCVIALNRPHKTLTGLSEDEWRDFTMLVNDMEYAVKKAFNATLINWGCLMNSFYLDSTPEPHLHWHFIPRYRETVIFAGLEFQDPHFGHMRPRPPAKISNEVRRLICQELKKCLP
jgi:diadenosine tetraphosphate (Ap4A) HIT family hydrolase